MIRVQLWKGDHQIGPDQKAKSEEEADKFVDSCITAVHAGQHGEGKFRLECDYTDERGVFLGIYYRTDLTFPFVPALQHSA